MFQNTQHNVCRIIRCAEFSQLLSHILISTQHFFSLICEQYVMQALPNLTLTFYCFLIGSLILFALSGLGANLEPVPDALSWLNVLGLAVIPTAIATITLAASSKAVGATKTSILGILGKLVSYLSFNRRSNKMHINRFDFKCC